MSAVESLSAPLERLRQRYSSSALPGFFRWWGGELLALLPVRWRERLLAGELRVLYEVDAGVLRVLVRQGDASAGERELARLPLDDAQALAPAVERMLDDPAGGDRDDDRPRWLVLPHGKALRRRIHLPLAAADRLREVLGFELDRQTPFRADQVSYDHRVVGRREASRQIEVELVVLTNLQLDAAFEPLGTLADGLAGVTVRDEHGRVLPVNLLPAERRRQRQDRTRRVNLALAAVTLVALLVALGMTLENQRTAVVELQTAVDARRAEASRVKALRDQLTDAAEGTSFLARARAQSPTVLELIADLSERIPDNTWLEKLAVDKGQVVLVALSPEAPALVGRLQESKLLRSPALSGSVQADPRTGSNRFTLTAQVVAPPAAVPDADAKRAAVQRRQEAADGNGR